MPTGGVVQTVLGTIAASDLGITLTHEHLLCDTRSVNYVEPSTPEGRALSCTPIHLEMAGWLQLNWTSHRDNLLLDDIDLAVAEAQRFRQAGGSTLVDCTVEGIGRNPDALVRTARQTGLNVVMGSGYYVAPTHPPVVSELSEERLAETMISDVRKGVGEAAIRAGLIGEIGISWPMHPREARVLRAAGMAQTALGCAVTVHPGRNPAAPAQILDTIRPTGVDVRRIIMAHLDRTVWTIDGLRALADIGCFLEFDLFGLETTSRHPYWADGIDMPSDAQRLDRIKALTDAGHGEQILLSQDVCSKHRLRRYGGFGYDHIVSTVVPWMLERDFDQRVIDTLLIDNPRRALAIML